MPETACLHIQARESGPVRVVDLHGGPVRIGRAGYCDVRIADPELADEACRLRRRGGAWQLVPVAGRESVRLDGRPVAEPSTLAFGATFDVGTHRLTLQSSSTSSPWPDRPAPAPHAEPVKVKEATGRELATSYRAEWQSGADAHDHDRPGRSQRETKRWESRWRAAGEKLRSAPAPGVAAVPVKTPSRPGPPSVEARAVLRPVDLPNRDRRPPAAPSAFEPPAGFASVIEAPPTSPTTGYVSPPAPRPRREPVRSSDWARPLVSKRPAPPSPVRPDPVERIAEPRQAPDLSEACRQVEPQTATDMPRIVDTPLPPDRAEACRVENLVQGPLPVAGVGSDVLSVSNPVTCSADRLLPSPRIEDGPHSGPYKEDGPHSGPYKEDGPHSGPYKEDGPHSGPYENNEERDRLDLDSGPGASDAGVARGEHVDLSNADFQALIARLQTLILAEISPARVEGESESSGELVDSSTGLAEDEGPGLAVLPIVEDEDEDRENEPETDRPLLGAARRLDRVERPGWRAGPATPDGWEHHAPFATAADFVRPTHDTGPEPGRVAIADVDEGTDRERAWPTFREILAAQGARPHRGTSVKAARGPSKARARRPEPTAANEPGQWRLPLWLGWLPASAAAVGVGVAGLTGAWAWSVDGYNAGLVAQRLAGDGPSKSPLPAGVAPSGGSWWSTSPAHLVQWAAYLDRAGGNDPAQAEEARVLLDRAASAGPLNPTVRYALARPSRGESPALELSRGLAQSRDVPALSWAGRRLLAAGKTGPALRAFRAALEMAASAALTRPGLPAFLDDSRGRRYALPAENLTAAVVRDMASSGAWTYKDWAGALPRGTVAAVIAARALRESGSGDAESALDAALAEAEATPPAPDASAPAEAVRLAAWAEALAMKQRWADARDRYRQAIDLMPVEVVRRAWWFNVADLSSRLDDGPERQKALEAAKVADLKDEITRRVVDLQRESGAVARRPGGRVAGSAAAVDSEARR